MKCTVCKHSYDEGQSKCPKCASPNPLLKPESYITIEVEMPSALFRGIQHCIKGATTPHEFILMAVENYISELNKK